MCSFRFTGPESASSVDCKGNYRKKQAKFKVSTMGAMRITPPLSGEKAKAAGLRRPAIEIFEVLERVKFVQALLLFLLRAGFIAQISLWRLLLLGVGVDRC